MGTERGEGGWRLGIQSVCNLAFGEKRQQRQDITLSLPWKGDTHV